MLTKEALESRIAEVRKNVDSSAAQYNFWVGRLEEASSLLNNLEKDVLNSTVESID